MLQASRGSEFSQLEIGEGKNAQKNIEQPSLFFTFIYSISTYFLGWFYIAQFVS